MTTAGTDLLLAPQAPWWPTLWPLPWYLTSAATLAWVTLRSHEKATLQPPGDDLSTNHFEQAA
jgi:hypothetical protein